MQQNNNDYMSPRENQTTESKLLTGYISPKGGAGNRTAVDKKHSSSGLRSLERSTSKINSLRRRNQRNYIPASSGI